MRISDWSSDVCSSDLLDFRRIIGRLVERRLGDLVVRDGNAETVAECAQRVLTHFLLLMRDVLAFASLTHAIALDGLGKDHRRRTLMLDRRRVGRVDLVLILATAIQPPNVFLGHKTE